MKKFTKLIQQQFAAMCSTGKLFRVALTGDEIWTLYLSSFLPEQDPIFRDPNSTTHNCNHCKNFIRRYGNIVAIDQDGYLITMFDTSETESFEGVGQTLSKAIRSSKIKEVFFETFEELNSLPYEATKKTQTEFQLGTSSNPKRYTKDESDKYGVVKPDEIVIFDHMHLRLPSTFVDLSGKSVEAIMGEYRDSKNVFQRGMEEISLDTLQLVKDLIIQGSLLDGETHLHKIEKMIPLKAEYDKLTVNKDNWCWTTSYKFQFAKFRNELIGVLCSELAEGKELNIACESWNKRVDPANYMKATAPITKKQIANAQLFVEENGYTESFNRRFATIEDIKVTEIKHINISKEKIKGVSIFDQVKPAPSTRHKRAEFEGVEEVTIDKFMKDILPTCTLVEAFLTNTQENNMVSLTTSQTSDSKPIFKWPNNYSWTFNGNLAGKSQIKEAVKNQGGKVDGVLRFSIMWAVDNIDNSDLDAHCIEPQGFHIYFSRKYSHVTGGNLDIDITHPQDHKRINNQPVVENITFPTMSRMSNGIYQFVVNQFQNRGSKGFTAEIEFNGEIFSYEYNHAVSNNVAVADVTLLNGKFTIKHNLPEIGTSTKEIYSLPTNQFHKVNLICLSPNHWDNISVGNKHYFFMLDKAQTPTSIRSFHNENLIPELLLHRGVMEVLGATHMIPPTKKQLSGLGFNATVRDEVILRLSGTHKRVIKVKF